jgi:putative endonuclease
MVDSIERFTRAKSRSDNLLMLTYHLRAPLIFVSDTCRLGGIGRPVRRSAYVPWWRNGRPACRQAGAHAIINNMYTVYVLRSIQRKYLYVGLSNNIERRVKQHQEGREQTTRPYRPFELVYNEQFHTRQEARARERYLKSGSGKEWLKMHLS